MVEIPTYKPYIFLMIMIMGHIADLRKPFEIYYFAIITPWRRAWPFI